MPARAPAGRGWKAPPATSPPTRRCSTRAASSRSSSGTYARYTPEMVERVCGVPRRAVPARCARRGRRTRAASAPLRSSTAWAGRSTASASQYIRAGAIIQLLLGNIGRPGGGVFALRGHASIQGSTDMPTLFNLLPGYLPMPQAGQRHASPTTSTASAATNQKGFWRNADAYMVSLLKEYWGEHATAENDFCFDYLPRINGDHGTYRTVMDMIDGKVFGYFLLGQNPAVGSAHGRLQRLGMANLDWLVVRDLVDDRERHLLEGRARRSRPARSRRRRAAPRCSSSRPPRTWRRRARSPRPSGCCSGGEKAVEPPGDQRSELWFFYHLGRIGCGSGSPARPTSATGRCWTWLGLRDRRRTSRRARTCCARINGYRPDRPGRAVNGYTELKADGTHRLRLLDLHRRVRRRGQPGRPAQAARRAGPLRARVGLDVADEPAGALQPRVGRPAGPAVERAQEAHLVGRRTRASGRATTSRTSRRPSRRTTGPPEGAVGSDGAARRRPVHHAGRRQGLAVRAQRRCSTGRCRRTTSRTSRRCATRSTPQQANPTRKVYGREDNPSNPSPPGGARRGVPVRVHRRAAHRAPHRGRHEPAAALPVGAAAGAVRRGLAGARARCAGWTHMGWAHVVTSRTRGARRGCS